MAEVTSPTPLLSRRPLSSPISTTTSPLKSTSSSAGRLDKRRVNLAKQREKATMALARRKANGEKKKYAIDLKIDRRRRSFIEYYLQGYNMYEAGIKAGYSESMARAASESIMNPAVKEEIARRIDRVLGPLHARAERIINETAALAYSNMLDYIKIEEDGSFRVDLSKVDRIQGSAIQELSYDVEGRPKIKLVDKKASLELLGRFKKLLSDRASTEHGGLDGAPLTISGLDAIIQQYTVNNIQINNLSDSERLQLPETIEASAK